MNYILSDEQMALIRYAADGPAEDDEPNSLLPMLRMLRAHHDAVVAQHAADLSHANSNADNLRVQVNDLTQTVLCLKNVLRSDEEQLKLSLAKAETLRREQIGAITECSRREVRTYRDAAIAIALDAAKYLGRAETAEAKLGGL